MTGPVAGAADFPDGRLQAIGGDGMAGRAVLSVLGVLLGCAVMGLGHASAIGLGCLVPRATRDREDRDRGDN